MKEVKKKKDLGKEVAAAVTRVSKSTSGGMKPAGNLHTSHIETQTT